MYLIAWFSQPLHSAIYSDELMPEQENCDESGFNYILEVTDTVRRINESYPQCAGFFFSQVFYVSWIWVSIWAVFVFFLVERCCFLRLLHFLCVGLLR